jgi:hypothetical protein
MAASHTGEDAHVRTLQGVLRRAGLTQSLLANGADGAPLDALTAARWRARARRQADPPHVLRLPRRQPAAVAPRRLDAGRLLAARAPQPAGGGRRRRAHLRHAPGPAAQRSRRLRPADLRLPAGRRRARLRAAGRSRLAADAPRLALAPAWPGARRDARRARDGRRHARLERHAADAARPGLLVAKGGAEGLRGIGLLAGARGKGKPAAGMAIKIEDGDGHGRGPTAR